MKIFRKLARWYLNREPKKILGKYKGTKIPTYCNELDCWVVEGALGLELGSIDYIMSEFTRAGVMYHFYTQWEPDTGHPDHEHTFSGVLISIADDPESFSYEQFKEEYSQQEREYIETILKKYREVKQNEKAT
jgi:hypothetical protein